MKIIQPIKDYFVGAYNEMRRVVWPTRSQTINNTLIVIVSVLIATIVFGLIDFGLSEIIAYFLERR